MFRRRRRRARLGKRIWRKLAPEVRAVLFVIWLLLLAIMWAWRFGIWICDRFITPEARLALIQDADKFYKTARWRALRMQRMAENLQRFGQYTCENCRRTNVGPWHAHHLNPRSTHPEQALDPKNVAIWCEDCNIGASNKYVGRELKPNPRLA